MSYHPTEPKTVPDEVRKAQQLLALMIQVELLDSKLNAQYTSENAYCVKLAQRDNCCMNEMNTIVRGSPHLVASFMAESRFCP